MQNFSFESPTVPTNPGFTTNQITGWSGGGGNRASFGDFGVQILAARLSLYPSGIPDGVQYSHVNSGFIFQGTGTARAAGATYTLTAYVGRRTDCPGA